MEMGRKNKVKKHANHEVSTTCYTPASSPDGSVTDSVLFGHFVSFTNQPIQVEAMKSNLRKLVGEGRRRLQYLYSELDKKTSELNAAKGIILQFQREQLSNVPSETDKSEEEDQLLEEKIRLNEQSTRQMNQLAKDLMPAGWLDDDSNERALHEAKLTAAEHNIARLEEEIKRLLAALEKTHSSLEECKKSANCTEDNLTALTKDLEAALQEANEKITSLENDVKVKEAELANCKQTKDDLSSELENVLREAASVQDQIDELADVVDKEKSETVQDKLQTAIKQEQLLREKCESRFDIINFGVQNIISDFHAVKTDLINTREKNVELHSQLKASKADTKYYKEDGETCRKYIKRLEEQINSSITTGNEEVQKTEQLVQGLQVRIQETEQSLMASIPSFEHLDKLSSLVSSIENEFKQELESGEVDSALTAVKQLKEHLRLEKLKNKDSLAVDSWEKLMNQNKELVDQLESLKLENEKQMKENRRIFEEDKHELEEKIESASALLRKVRKERDSSSKKWKRKLDESNSKSQILEVKAKELEDKLNETMNDSSLNDGSFRSVSEKSDFNSSQEMELDGYRKTISKLESRILELQRATEHLKKRHEDDMTATVQKLESTENSLEVQQDLNAKLSRTTEELRQKHSAEVAKLTEECRRLEENLKNHMDRMDEMREARIDLVESIESELEAAEYEKRRAVAELSASEASLQDIKVLAAELQREVEQVHKWNSNKMDELKQADEMRKLLEAENQELKSKLVEIEKKLAANKIQSSNSVSDTALALTEAESLSREVTRLKEIEQEHLIKIAELISTNENNCEMNAKKLNQLEAEIAKMKTTLTENEEAILEMAEEIERKDGKHEIELEAEKEKHEKLREELEAEFKNAENMPDLQRLLDESELKLKAYGMASESTLAKIKQVESELVELKTQYEKNLFNGHELDQLKQQNIEKDALIEEQVRRNILLGKELDDVKRLLSDAQSLKKDKVLQLENRLEVFQNSAKTQSKRYEEDLDKARKSLQDALTENEQLLEQVDTLHKVTALAEELTVANQAMSEELTRSITNEESVHILEKKILLLEQHSEELESENKHERAGLIDELIATKEKLEDFQKLAAKNRSGLDKIELLESQLAAAKSLNEQLQTASNNQPFVESPDHIDKLFPSMDPAMRQFLRLMTRNPNFAYGMVGFLVYAFLIHLYILL